ncbi:nuclear transport factor 2 family protein [Clostridium sp. P21]|uniref:Nuclear transport factor 2 family protein n=1 Tax=Clostridium muellerianum TaxID=2716538 RepID=A0A7Y0HND0_9CLOT|nr:nuclear transport factor 2 family protein [Clostridium muellerianum]NMM63030.1 nuclear transport factor 2 family protein [Clostridium muellerianum]
MVKYEHTIGLWFNMWLEGKDLGIKNIFSSNCIYIESWGPKYIGVEAVKHWFDEWNTRGKVLTWEIKQYFHKENQTVVEWYFKNSMKDGRIENFDGTSIIEWDDDGKIKYLKEFGCKLPNYNPYENGDVPKLKNIKMWT